MRRSSMPGLLLLDTHVWIWQVARDGSLSKRSVLNEIERARDEGSLRVSAMSVWEVGMLESKGRIRLGMDCLDWVRQALDRSGVVVVPLSPEIAVASTRLPGGFRGDPADSVIVATARELKARLVTADERLKAYADQGFVDVLPA